MIEEIEGILERHREYYKELLETKEAITMKEKNQEEFIERYTSSVLRIRKGKEKVRTTREEIQRSISELKLKKCHDAGGWRYEIISLGGEEMIKSLEMIFNEIEEIKCIPNQWNEMIIKSIHKQGKIQDMTNKRGIFLTNVVGKTYEKVLKIGTKNS